MFLRLSSPATHATILLSMLFLLSACALSGPERAGYDRDTGSYREAVVQQSSGYTQTGMISYYGAEFQGRRTASGVPFDKNGLTAAHRTLPFHTKVKVTNLSNGKSVVVEITDRGPYAHGRILDVSLAAARAIGLTGKGTAKAKITVL